MATKDCVSKACRALQLGGLDGVTVGAVHAGLFHSKTRDAMVECNAKN